MPNFAIQLQNYNEGIKTMKNHHVTLVQSIADRANKYGIQIINSNGKNVLNGLSTTDDNLFRATFNNKSMSCNTTKYNVTPSNPTLIDESLGGTVYCTSAVICRSIERFISNLAKSL